MQSPPHLREAVATGHIVLPPAIAANATGPERALQYLCLSQALLMLQDMATGASCADFLRPYASLALPER
jgi:hypothetical protein